MFKIELDLDFDTVIGERHYNDGGPDQPHSVEPYRFGEMVVQEVALQLVRSLTDEIRSDMRRAVRDRTTELIDQRLAPIVEAALEGDIPITNHFGESTGRTTTMREMIIEQVGKHLRRSGSRQSYDDTVFDKVLKETTQQVLTKDLADEVAAAKAEIRSAVATSAAEVMSDAIVKGLTTR